VEFVDGKFFIFEQIIGRVLLLIIDFESIVGLRGIRAIRLTANAVSETNRNERMEPKGLAQNLKSLNRKKYRHDST
jgi:hypothetical protein